MNFPVSEDPPEHRESYSPSSRDNLKEWKYNLIRDIVETGSIDSIVAIQYLDSKFPGSNIFKWHLINTKENAIKKLWNPPSPKELKELLHNSEKRFIRSGEELIDVIIESLMRLQKKLQGNNPKAFFLWDKSDKKYKPKDENALSDFVQMHLD